MSGGLGSLVQLERTVFDANESKDGGGIHVTDSSLVIRNVVLSGNEAKHDGGGLHLESSDAALDNVQVVANASRAGAGGGIYVAGAAPTLNNLIVAGNWATKAGGGVYLDNARAHIAHAVVAHNGAGEGGGGLRAEASEVALSSSILYENIAPHAADIQARRSDVAVQYSALYNWHHCCEGLGPLDGVDGNTVVDPGFLQGHGREPEAWDFHLAADSPLIDQGDPADTDPDGSPADPGCFGGSRADDWDLDGDGLVQWWHPGPYQEDDEAGGWDCSDRAAGASCEPSGCSCSQRPGRSRMGWFPLAALAAAALRRTPRRRTAATATMALPLLVVSMLFSSCAADPCDGIDNDGDGQIDEDSLSGERYQPFFEDLDGDGYGVFDASTETATWSCVAPPDHSARHGDCDDTDATVSDGAVEACDGRDNDCNGVVDDVDLDGDGRVADTCGGDDCDDGDASMSPGNTELCGDGVDNDCSGVVDDRDWDEDGHVAEECGGDDCDDYAAATHTGAPESCDGVDNDCDGEVPPDEFEDADGDGYVLCEDCDDSDRSVHPGVTEQCDGVDANCDGIVDTSDHDGGGVPDCEEALVLLSEPFAREEGICPATGITYSETELEAVEWGLDQLGFAALATLQDQESSLNTLVQERPLIVLLNGGLPWDEEFLDDPFYAVYVAHAMGTPVLVVGADAAHGASSGSLFSFVTGIAGFQTDGVPDTVGFQSDHPIADGPHGEVVAFYVDEDIDQVQLSQVSTAVGVLQNVGTAAVVAVEGGESRPRSTTVLFSIEARWDGCLDGPSEDRAALLLNTLSWLTQ